MESRESIDGERRITGEGEVVMGKAIAEDRWQYMRGDRSRIVSYRQYR